MEDGKRGQYDFKNIDAAQPGLDSKDKVQRRLFLHATRPTLELKRYSSPPGSINAAFISGASGEGADDAW